VEKIWFIIIAGNKEGPFSFLDLKKDDRISPDTLAWRQGFPDWLPIRDIKELEDLFKEEPPVAAPEEEEQTSPATLQDDEVMALKKDPYFSLWVLLAVILVVYVFYLLLSR
jgi:hypothetical protein